MGRRNPTYYNVRPRYTAGSPWEPDILNAEETGS